MSKLKKLLTSFIGALTLFSCAPTSVPVAAATRTLSSTKTCPDGRVIRSNQKCTIKPTQTCYDGTIILTTQTCPTQPSTYTLSGWTANAGSPAIWTITRTKGTVAETVEFRTTNGTAIAGTDYTSTDQIVSFAVGQATAQVSVPTVIDTGHYGTTLTFTGSVIYAGSTVASGGSSIVEPAAPITPSLSLSLNCANGDAGTDIACNIGRSVGTSSFSIQFQTSNGTATAGTDYTAVNQSVSFAIGVLTQTVSVHTFAGSGSNKTFNATATYLANTASSVGTIIEASAPPAVSLADVLDEGDSISYFWGGNHTGMYSTNHPAEVYRGNAVSGSWLGSASISGVNSLYSRQSADLAYHPKVMSILIGANDVPNVTSNWYTEYTTPTAWFNGLMAYVAPFRTAGTKVAVGTILPQCITGNPEGGSDLVLNQNRATINALIRNAVGTQIDAVIDYAADPTIGPDAAACNATYYNGGLHPTDGATGGQGKMLAVYTPVIDSLLSGITNDNPLIGQSIGVGAPDIATTDHNVNNDLQNSWGTGAIPSSNAPDVVGAFRFICRHTNAKYDDPTVYPNQVGASHLHDQTGVNEWSAYSNYVNLRTGGGGSGCNDVEGTDQNTSEATWAANRTPYWQPALLDGKGNMILVDYISVYYKRRPLSDPLVSDPNNAQYIGKGVKLPNGLKFIFGSFPGNSSMAPSPAATYDCTNGPAGGTYPNDHTFAGALACAKSHSDGQFKVGMSAPDCWDGVNLDSADHRSHLSYGTYTQPNGYYKCDTAHPYVIPAYTYVAFYTVLSTDNGDIHWASDDMDTTKPRGWSFHVDYGPAAWDPTVLNMWENGCIDQLLNCSGGDLGNGKQLKGAAQPIYLVNGVWTQAWRNPQRLVPIPVHP